MVEDIYVGEFYVGSEFIRYARAAPSVPTATRPVATALRCHPSRSLATTTTAYRYQLASPSSAMPCHNRRKTGERMPGKYIHTYYTEHTKLNLVDTQRIKHQRPFQSQQAARNEGRNPSVES
jgi:hypothetical protein